MTILTPCAQPYGSSASLKYKSVNLFSGCVEAMDSIPAPSLYQTRHQVSYLQDKSSCLTAVDRLRATRWSDVPQSSMLGPPSRQSSGANSSCVLSAYHGCALFHRWQ